MPSGVLRSPPLSPLAPKTVYSPAAGAQYAQTQQTRQVTAIKPAAASPATSTFSIYPVSSTVQPVAAAAAASVVPAYSQSPTYSTNAVTYSGKPRPLPALPLYPGPLMESCCVGKRECCCRLLNAWNGWRKTRCQNGFFGMLC